MSYLSVMSKSNYGIWYRMRISFVQVSAPLIFKRRLWMMAVPFGVVSKITTMCNIRAKRIYRWIRRVKIHSSAPYHWKCQKDVTIIQNRFTVIWAIAIHDCIAVSICGAHHRMMSIQSVIHHHCCIQIMHGRVVAAHAVVHHNPSNSTSNNINWEKIIHTRCPVHGVHHSKIQVKFKVIVRAVIATFSIHYAWPDDVDHHVRAVIRTFPNRIKAPKPNWTAH